MLGQEGSFQSLRLYLYSTQIRSISEDCRKAAILCGLISRESRETIEQAMIGWRIVRQDKTQQGFTAKRKEQRARLQV
jgi:hypothetical protein